MPTQAHCPRPRAKRYRGRGEYPRNERSFLSIFQILAWADDHQRRTGKWPQVYSGPVPDAVDEKWRNVDNALRYGLRGLPGGSSLAQLLAQWRGLRNTQGLAPLTEEQILAWAEAHYQRTGAWPTAQSGRIEGSGGEVWSSVNAALRDGGRGLAGQLSLAQLLAQRRGVRNRANIPSLTTVAILAWADAHYQRTGTWPQRRSGPISDAPGETWHAVELALNRGLRGLPGGSSLPQLLAECRKVRNRADIPPLSIPRILAWARAYYHRRGTWPTYRSGPILEATGETWRGVDAALRKGHRGLPGKSSLTRLLEEERKQTTVLGLEWPERAPSLLGYRKRPSSGPSLTCAST